MAATLEELEQRLAIVEQELTRWRQRSGISPAERGAGLLRHAEEQQAQITAGMAAAFEQMGISGEPIGAAKVQELIAAGGVRPEDNEFSRGIIEMREE